MYMHEFKVIKSATSSDQLRRSLKSEELEKYGEPFTPEFVYEAIRQLPRFASMRVSRRLWSMNATLIASSEVISKMLKSSLGSYFSLSTTSAFTS